MMTLAERLEQYVRNRGEMEVRDIAKKLDISTVALYDMRRGKLMPGPDTTLLIADLFGENHCVFSLEIALEKLIRQKESSPAMIKLYDEQIIPLARKYAGELK